MTGINKKQPRLLFITTIPLSLERCPLGERIEVRVRV
jgi:hypothetical protein